MEDADGRLFISEGYIPTIGWNSKEFDDHEGRRMGGSASINFNISKEKTMKELMEALDKLYEKPSTSNKVFLMRRIFNMKMSEGGSVAGSVADHLNEFNTFTNQNTGKHFHTENIHECINMSIHSVQI